MSVNNYAKLWNRISGLRCKALRQVTRGASCFKTYYSVALSEGAIDRIYQIWKSKKNSDSIFLSEDDFMSMAATLAIRKHPQTSNILSEQLQRIENADRNCGLNICFLLYQMILLSEMHFSSLYLMIQTGNKKFGLLQLWVIYIILTS